MAGQVRFAAMSPWSRLQFLVAGSGAAVLAACGSSASSGSDVGGKGYSLVRRFSADSIVAGLDQRLVFSLINASDQSGVSQGPASFQFQLVQDGKPAGTPLTATRRQTSATAPIWDFRTLFPTAGTWEGIATFPDKSTTSVAFSVLDRSQNKMPTVGDKLVKVATPTTANPQGVNPVCTRQPACPFHAVSLDEAMAAGKAVALLVGTPAYCQTGVCGPVLDLLIDGAKAFPNLTVIHAEVYTKAYTDANTPTTDTVNAYNLSFEPYLVVADGTGTIKARLDVVWDASELKTALSAAGV
jgi:hypothetical protein